MDEKKSIKELVLERLAKSGPASLDRVVSAMTQQEEDVRHELLLKAIKLQEVYEGQVKAASRPDVQLYQSNGESQQQAFSAAGIKALKMAKEKLAKLSTCFDKCLEAPTAELYKELKQLVDQGSNQAKAPSAEEVRAGN
jgi:hypothetical protein